MCKDPQHHAQRFGPKAGRFLGFIALGVVGVLAFFCPSCWRGRIDRVFA